jgi:hypothetical protein
VTDPEGLSVERILDVNADDFAVAAVGNKMAFRNSEFVFFADLDGNILDSIETVGTSGRFSTVCDSLYYIYVLHEGVRRYNLNTMTYDVIVPHNYDYAKTPFNPVFDLFPRDSALLMGDTIYSLTSNEKRILPVLDVEYDCYVDCTINPVDPRFVAFSDFVLVPEGDTTWFGPGYYLIPVIEDLSIMDITDGSYTILKTTPRSTKKREYSYYGSPEFSPDGNTITYTVYTQQNGVSGIEIARIMDVLEE